ncbi:MAG TPA: pilus assembly protein TadG-related protein [Bryobacteraceae bacterium]|nr:pilus assembly protein TadG-related protein [Bryobacteraceae bacterium]
MVRRGRSNHGQAVLMMTLALFTMAGMLALAVDLGWAHYLRQSAQKAAEAAALAAAQVALNNVGQGSTFTCGTGVTCQAATACATPVPNPPGGNLDNGCLYAAQNGFTTNGDSGRQSVSLQADVTTPPPTVPGITVNYWVTARTSVRMPMLFGALMGSSTLAAARATAAVLNLSVYGSLLLLNHENDCLPMESTNNLTCGVDLLVSANNNQGHPALQADGGILLASQKNGTSADGRYAGENTGGGLISAPYTYIRGTGSYTLSGSSQWVQTPQNNDTANLFEDPMRGKGQPAPPTGLSDVQVPGGHINGSSDPGNPLVLAPGNYYATAMDKQGRIYATGASISISGYVRFGSGGSGFGSYVVYGGVSLTQSGTTVTFDPGMYVLAGVQPQSGKPGQTFSVSSNASIQDGTAGYGQNTDAGEIFIFTDTNYQGQGQSLQVPALVQAIASNLQQGTTGFQTGSSGASVNLHGLNAAASSLPASLKPFAPVALWQDQANSVVKYDANGNIDTSCGNSDGCPNTSLVNNQSPQLVLQGSPSFHVYGTVYQPRGAWTTIQGGGDYQVPVQLIAGAMRVQGNSNFSMVQPVTPVQRRMVALVE